MKIERYVTTSLGMVIERGTGSPPRDAVAEPVWRFRRAWAEKVLDASVADPHELRTRLRDVNDVMWARERRLRRRLHDGVRRRLPFGPPVVVPPVPYRSSPAVVAYLVWRMLPGDDVAEIVGDWPPCGEAVRITGKTMREVPFASLPELPRLPAASGGTDVAILLDVVHRVRPADVPHLTNEVARITRRFAFVTVPSFGVDAVSPPDGPLHGKVRPERVAHYEALGLDYDGPVPADDVDPEFARPGGCTVASVAWWTERFADAGLIRCAGVEQRLVPHLHRFEAYGRWKIFVLRRLDVAEPVGELHPDDEIVEMAVQLGLEPL